MGLSWTDRVEDVSAHAWDSVLVRSFRPSPFLSRPFLAPWAKTLAAVVVSGRETEFWSEFLSSSRDFLSSGPLLLPNLVDGSPSIACLPRLCAGLVLSFRLEEMGRAP